MSEPLRLTRHDRVMIHALGILSRPGVTAGSRVNFDMFVGILGEVLPAVSADERLKPLADLAARFARYTPTRPGHYGPLHSEADQAMNRWDQQCMAASWEIIREKVA